MLSRLIRIEVSVDSSCRLVVLGFTVRHWAAVDYPGWGSPLAMLFTRDWISPAQPALAGEPEREP